MDYIHTVSIYNSGLCILQMTPLNVLWYSLFLFCIFSIDKFYAHAHFVTWLFLARFSASAFYSVVFFCANTVPFFVLVIILMFCYILRLIWFLSLKCFNLTFTTILVVDFCSDHYLFIIKLTSKHWLRVWDAHFGNLTLTCKLFWHIRYCNNTAYDMQCSFIKQWLLSLWRQKYMKCG